MGFSVRRESVALLARELAAARGTTMTDAIEAALREALERERKKLPLSERLEALAQRVRAEAGPNRRDVTKEEIDEMWGQ